MKIDTIEEKGEIHLYIIWEKAAHKRDAIISDINDNFKILDIFEISWSAKNFSRNISRFYGEKLPKGSHKERHCGTGPFTLIIIRDPFPVYAERNTSKGSRIVNSKMFDAKDRYRSWTGGGHKIHGTNSELETRHDLFLLLGHELESYKEESRDWGGQVTRIRKDLIGAIEWKNIEELFRALNSTVGYVVLRNFECLPAQYHLESHGDIDLLVDDLVETTYVINGKKVFKRRGRAQYKVKIAGQDIPFDIRHVGDNYYCTTWENDILQRREYLEGKNIFIPSSESYFFSLLYHALVHKREFSKDYADRLLKMIKDNENLKGLKYEIITIDRGRNILLDFMRKMSYALVAPNDVTVYFNSMIGDPKGTPFFLKLERSMYDVWTTTKVFIKSILRHYGK